jgi:hypothetical protein
MACNDWRAHRNKVAWGWPVGLSACNRGRHLLVWDAATCVRVMSEWLQWGVSNTRENPMGQSGCRGLARLHRSRLRPRRGRKRKQPNPRPTNVMASLPRRRSIRTILMISRGLFASVGFNPAGIINVWRTLWYGLGFIPDQKLIYQSW